MNIFAMVDMLSALTYIMNAAYCRAETRLSFGNVWFAGKMLQFTQFASSKVSIVCFRLPVLSREGRV